VGDEQKREDPTVLELESRAAELLGHEASVYLPTATMANQIAIRILTEPGDVVIAEEHSHLFIAEQGGPAAHSGLFTRPLPGYAGRLAPEQIRAAMTDPRSGHEPVTKLVSLENTHNSSGGRVWPLDELGAVVDTARELGLRVHLDGARVVNAAVALGVPAAEIGGRFDTVTLCLSKGLGCPLGAVVAGSEELMVKARRAKHLFGGAMRQAGIVAAAGVYALDHHVERLNDDHARARRLAEGLAAAGLAIDLDAVETNFVQLDVEPYGLTKWDALARLREHGVGLSATVHPTRLRAVTHLDVSDDDIDRAIDLIPRALGVLVEV
jgi:threonine aldolase